MSNQEFMIIAHRGASFYAPENTMASVRLAWEQGADAVEVDVHLSKDGHAVVIHDDNTLRTAGVDKMVKEQTLSELKTLDAGRWKGTRWHDEHIPTLKEVIENIPDNKKIFIEVKGGPACLPVIRKVIDSCEILLRQVTIMDFDIDTMIMAKKQCPGFNILWLVEYENPLTKNTAESLFEEILDKAAAARVDGINLQATNLIDAVFIDKARETDLDCFVWTVNDPDLSRYFKRIGLSGVTTDRPAWIRSQLV